MKKGKAFVMALFIPLILTFCVPEKCLASRKVVIKLGTLAPEGTPWHDALMNMAAEWARVSGGRVKLKIYSGGVAGSEIDMVRKMRIGQLHAASLTSLGIMQIDRAYMALQVPTMISSYEELDYCRERIRPIIEKRMREKGFVVLNYGDFGFLYFFTTQKVTTVNDLLSLRMGSWAADQVTKALWKKAGFIVIDLDASETLTALQTGLVNGFINSPVFALSMQWFAKAKYMLNVNYGPLVGATVVSKKTWEKIDPHMREELIAIASQSAEGIKATVRSLDQKAIDEMKKYGLEVYTPETSELPAWKDIFAKNFSLVRHNLIPADVFDQVLKLRNEFRNQKREQMNLQASK